MGTLLASALLSLLTSAVYDVLKGGVLNRDLRGHIRFKGFKGSHQI